MPILALLGLNLGLYWCLPAAYLRESSGLHHVFDARYSAERSLSEGLVYGGDGWLPVDTSSDGKRFAEIAGSRASIDFPALTEPGSHTLLVRASQQIGSVTDEKIKTEVNGLPIELRRLADSATFQGVVSEQLVHRSAKNSVVVYPPSQRFRVELISLFPQPRRDTILLLSDNEVFAAGWSPSQTDPACRGYRTIVGESGQITLDLPSGNIQCKIGVLVHDAMIPDLDLRVDGERVLLQRKREREQFVFEGEFIVPTAGKVDLVFRSAGRATPISRVELETTRK